MRQDKSQERCSMTRMPTSRKRGRDDIKLYYGHEMGMLYRGIMPPYQCPSGFGVVIWHMNVIDLVHRFESHWVHFQELPSIFSWA